MYSYLSLFVFSLLLYSNIIASRDANYTQNYFEHHEEFLDYPEIEFNYDWRSYVMDFFGSWFFDASVTEDLTNQLNSQLPRFIAAWRKDAPVFFRELVITFQKGIKARNRNAIINLSHGSSYGSQWFLVFGLRWFLDPEPWGASVSKEDAFSSLVFHELLHVWVDDNIRKDKSEYLEKYKNEDSLVLDHLHLMAIQKMIYLKINRQDLLNFIDESYRSNQGPFYKRAWEIVNDVEGYESILADVVF